MRQNNDNKLKDKNKAVKKISYKERVMIEMLYKDGLKWRSIAKKLWRDKRSIEREIKRNWYENRWGKRVYKAEHAQIRSHKRRDLANRKHNKLLKIENYWFLAKVRELMSREKYRLSPDAIVWRLSLEKCKKIVSTTTIYRYINKFEPELKRKLRHKWLKYKKRTTKYWTNSKLMELTSIEKRPQEINDRSRIWDWELDLIVWWKWWKAVLITLVDRKTKKTLIGRAKSKETKEVISSIRNMLEWHIVKSITTDNWTEFTDLIDLVKELWICWFRCHPYSSYEKWTNENTNGKVRWYIPKWAKLEDYSDEYVKYVMQEINSIPRKILGYRTADEAYYGNKLTLL
jgi:transposase, IS30 family